MSELDSLLEALSDAIRGCRIVMFVTPIRRLQSITSKLFEL